VKNLIIEALKDQREIFGDELYTKIEMPEIVKVTEKESDAIFKPNFLVAESKPEKIIMSEKVQIFDKAKSIDELNGMINTCLKCPLGNTRNKFVFGVGNPNADAMVIGEAPGADEDEQGLPFVGRAGKLLTDILKAIKFERDDVYIANILKCRPPNNRNPLPSEMEECIPYLNKQIELIKPKAILCVGLVAAQGLLKIKSSLTKMRGNVFEYNGIKTMVTYHPAALLRNPNWKRGCWEDVQQFRKMYDELVGK